ncbi:MAG TPA: hypothetical protein VM030_01125 [Acidimicrobiales bacterium]|nr:hypothetical protein [Acidimicrobiales bacterium]
MTRTCSFCGSMTDGPEDGLPEGWSLATDRGRVEYLCAVCTRSHVRSIEANLPTDFWE